MKKLFIIILLAFTSIIAQNNIVWTDVTSTYPSLPQGVKLIKGERTTPALKIYYFDVDLNNQNIAVRPYISSSINTVPNLTHQFGAYGGINGGFFGGSSSYSTVVYPNEVKAQNVGSLTRNGKTYPVIRSMFGLKTDFSMAVDWIYHFGSTVNDIYTFNAPLPYGENDPNPLPVPVMSNGTKYQNLLVGIGGAPVLVKNGVKNITYNQEIMWGSGVGYDNQDPRTGIGYTANKHCLLMVADGRLTASLGVSLIEFADIFLSLGCVEAINLDGGGSSQIAVGNTAVNLTATRSLPVIFAVINRDSLGLPQTPTFEKILDTGGDSVALVGAGWFASGNSGYWGTTPCMLNPKGDGSSYAEYRFKVPAPGYYNIYGWWVSANNRCTDTPFLIKHDNKTDTVKVDQTKNGSVWSSIGKYYFTGDTTERVLITNDANNGTYVCADGIAVRRYGTTDVENTSPAVISEYKLEQNYPNPFNPNTVINYSTPTGGNVKLEIFNSLGERVMELVNQYQDAGSHFVVMNAAQLTSGVYFYKLSSGSFSQSKRMVLVK